MTLMPVSSMTFFGSRSANGGGSRWIGQYVSGWMFDDVGVERLAEHVVDVTEHALADGHA